MPNPKGNIDSIRQYQWKPGQTGNPKGINRYTRKEKAAQAVEEYLDEAVQVLVQCAKDPTAPHAARIQAAQALMDRG